MWIFLASEALLFGSLIALYQIFYYRNHHEFKLAAADLHFYLGTLNTVVLLTSSALVARAQEKNDRRGLLAAIFLGLIFLGIKSHEYVSLTESGKFPLHFGNLLQSHKLFFTFYGYLTFLHSIHVLIGIALLSYVWWIYRKRADHERIEENIGLYWHFVDIVWVFLYPLFYLAGRQ
jgi:cytochrome c oxidase subunit 3